MYTIILLMVLTAQSHLAKGDECHVKGKTLEVGPELFHMTLDIELPNFNETKPWDISIEFEFQNNELFELLQLIYVVFDDEVKIYDILNSTRHKRDEIDEDTDHVIHTISWNNSKEVSMGGNVKLIIQRSTSVISYNKLLINEIEQTCKTLDAAAYSTMVDKPEDWPWLAALYMRHEGGLTFKCGGSVISKRVVITAAHCMQGQLLDGTFYTRPAADFIVVLRQSDSTARGENEFSVTRNVRNITIHPDYTADVENKTADIAVVVLLTPIIETDQMKPVSLYNDEIGLNDASTKWTVSGTVVGWGTDEEGNVMTQYPNFLTMPIVSDEDCMNIKYDKADNNTFCVGGDTDGTSPCTGDKGGGLYVKRKQGEWYLRGIASVSGKENCDTDNHIVFTDVSKYYRWTTKMIEIYDNIEARAVKNVEPGAWPSVVTIYQTTVLGLKYRCSGTLISDLHVITAAACLHTSGSDKQLSAKELVLYVGRRNLNIWADLDNSQSRNVYNVSIISPDELSTSREENLAVLRLQTPVSLNFNVQPINIWNLKDSGQESDFTEDSKNIEGTVVTWFKDKNGDANRNLKQTNITIVSNAHCILPSSTQETYKENKIFCAAYSTDSKFYITNTGGAMYTYEKISCDSYADWICKYDWVLRGIVSDKSLEVRVHPVRDVDSSEFQGYVLFTNVYKFVPLLRKIVKPKLIEDNSTLYDAVFKLAYDKDRSAKLLDDKRNVAGSTCSLELARQWSINEDQAVEIANLKQHIATLQANLKNEQRMEALMSTDVIIFDVVANDGTPAKYESTTVDQGEDDDQTEANDSTSDTDETISSFEQTTPISEEEQNTTNDSDSVLTENVNPGPNAIEDETRELKINNFKNFEKLLEKCGENHPDTINLATNFVSMFGNNKLDLAIDIYKILLKKMVEINGEDHLRTIEMLNALASKFRIMHKYNEALKTSEKVLEIKKRLLGEDDSNIVPTISEIAYTLEQMNQNVKALEKYKKILEIQKKIPSDNTNSDIINTKAKILGILPIKL